MLRISKMLLVLTTATVWLHHSVAWAPWIVSPTTDSVPQGHYVISPGGSYALLGPGTLKLGVERGYIAPKARVLKRIHEGPYCVEASGGVLMAGERLRHIPRDKQGRAMPRLEPGCHDLEPGWVFVYGDKNPRSFDSRYTGPVKREQIVRRMRHIGGLPWTL